MSKPNAAMVLSLVLCSAVFAQSAPSASGDANRNLAIKPAATQEASANKQLALAIARANEAETAASLTAEGRAIYASGGGKGSFTDFKYGAYRLIDKGEFRQAIRSAAVALFLSNREGNATQTAYAMTILATAFLAGGDLGGAERFATEAKKLYVYPTYRADIHTTSDKLLGDVALRRGEIDKAIAAYLESINSALGDTRFYSRVALASAYLKAKKPEKSKEVLDKAETYLEALPAKQQPVAKGSLFRIRALTAIGEGKPDLAIDMYKAALQAVGTSEDATYDKFWILDGLAQAHFARADREATLKTSLEAIDLSERIRGQFRSEELKSALFGEMQGVYDLAIRALIESGQHGTAWEINERGRSRALLDMLRNRIELASGSNVFAETTDKSPKLAELTGKLKAGEVLLSYRVLNDRTIVWISRTSGTRVATIAAGRGEIAMLVQDFRDAVIENKPAVNGLGGKLYDLLIKPASITPGESLIVLPHEGLHYLPFQALWTGDGYLAQKSAISYAPSVGALLAVMARQASPSEKFFALGNPDLGDPMLDLPGAQREVEGLSKLFQKSESYYRGEATRARFTKDAPGAKLIHVAAHGTVDALDPLHSKLHLAKEPDHPGTIEAREIYGMSLGSADLVALSACESGLGKVSRGDEIWGFTRSFLAAGAPSLLVSLWPVSDDATELLMRTFYDQMTRGSDRREALRKAEIAVLSDSRFSAPVFWAPFNLVGSPR